MENFFAKHKNNIILTIGVILVAIIAFGTGRLSMSRKVEPIVIRDRGNVLQASAETAFNSSDNGNQSLPTSNTANSADTSQVSATQKTSFYLMKDLEKYPGMFVSSKNSEIYHWPWCRWAKNIKKENEVWYKNEEQAKKAGKTRGSNFETIAPQDY